MESFSAEFPAVRHLAPERQAVRGTRQPGARSALLLFSAINVLNFMDRMAPNAIKELIIRDLHLTDAQSALPGTLGMVTYMLFGQVAGWIMDNRIVDPRNLLSLAVVIWSIATFYCGYAHSLLQLAAARIVVSAGESCFAAVAYPLLTDYYPPHERPAAYSIVLATFALGCALGFFLGGALGEAFGWRMAMFIVGAPGLVLAALVHAVTLPAPGINDEPELAGANDAVEEGRGVFSQIVRAYSTILCEVHWVFCCACCVLVSIGFSAAAEWYPAFLLRTAGIGSKEAGIVVGFALAVGGFFGTLVFGRLVQYLATKYQNAYFLVPAICMIPATAAQFCAMNLATTTVMSCIWLTTALFFAFSYQASSTVIMLTVLPPRFRGQSTALATLISRLFDITGPMGVGLISDLTDLHTAMQMVWITGLLATIMWWIGYTFLPPMPRTVQDGQAGHLSFLSLLLEGEKSQDTGHRASLVVSGKKMPRYSAM